MSQILDNVPFTELAEVHLDSLKLLRVSEGTRLDYKAELNMASSTDRRELCKDISAFANSQGGYILFGVSEANGVIDAVGGIDFGDSEEQRLMQILTSGIAPRVQSVDHARIPLRNGKVVLILKVEPDGFLHQVKYDDNRYYKRTGTITIAMDSSDVETFFTAKGPNDRNEEILKTIQAYHGALRSREYFKGVPGGGISALVIIPEVASYKLDFSRLPHDFNLLFPPIYCSGWDSEITGRARYTFGRRRDEKAPYAVTEITELGECRAFNSLLLERYGRDPLPENVAGYVPSIAFEREMISATHKYLASLEEVGVSPPFYVNCALLNVRAYILYVDPIRVENYGRILTQDEVLPAPVKFMSRADFASRDAVSKTLRPAFDYIWREFGFRRSFNYNEEGEWKPER